MHGRIVLGMDRSKCPGLVGLRPRTVPAAKLPRHLGRRRAPRSQRPIRVRHSAVGIETNPFTEGNGLRKKSVDADLGLKTCVLAVSADINPTAASRMRLYGERRLFFRINNALISCSSSAAHQRCRRDLCWICDSAPVAPQVLPIIPPTPTRSFKS
jgi:hypothetical protein